MPECVVVKLAPGGSERRCQESAVAEWQRWITARGTIDETRHPDGWVHGGYLCRDHLDTWRSVLMGHGDRISLLEDTDA